MNSNEKILKQNLKSKNNENHLNDLNRNFNKSPVKPRSSEFGSKNPKRCLRDDSSLQFDKTQIKCEPNFMFNEDNVVVMPNTNLHRNDEIVKHDYYVVETSEISMPGERNNCDISTDMKLDSSVDLFYVQSHQDNNEISNKHYSNMCVKLESKHLELRKLNDLQILNYSENLIEPSVINCNTGGLKLDCINNVPYVEPPNNCGKYNLKPRSVSSVMKSKKKLNENGSENWYKNCKKGNTESFVINVDPAVIGTPESTGNVSITGTGNVFPCKKCDRSFPLEQLLNLHERNHVRERNFVCAHCDKRFYNKSDLHHHVIVHMDKKPFACTLCNKAFRRKTLLTKHILFHGGKQKLSSCTICTKLFISDAELKEHVMKIHKQSKQFLCNICKCSFATKHTLRRHEIRRHNKDSKFSCDYCREMFSSGAKLTRHLVTHADSRPFTCKVCTKSFTLSHHLSQHMGIHAPEKLFTCHHCSRSYTRRDSLDVHMRIHTGLRPYGCSYCFKLFSTKVQLTRHLKIHKDRFFKCSLCSKTFVNNTQLQRHFKLHERE